MEKRFLVLMIFSALLISSQGLYAFENKKTHPAITGRAVSASMVDNYLKTHLGLSAGINTQLSYNFSSDIEDRIYRAQWSPEKTQRPALEWLELGSAIEDEDGDKYPIRARHHFYDPTRNSGLNNKDDNPNWHGWPNNPFKSFDLTGQSALVWAVDGTAPQKPKTNEQFWQSARSDFYNSMTLNAKNDREKYLAMTFLDLGCIIHMLEDMGVPAHTRNDFLFAHYRDSKDYGEPLERWVEIKIPDDGSLSLARWISPDWTPTPQVFNKVSNYFDTDTRNSSSYLGDGVLPPDSWGLSEATNYQFLSWSTIFKGPSTLYYFPQPDKIHASQVSEMGRTFLFGYGVNHLAQQTISYYRLKHSHLSQAWCVLGGVIFDDYANITIPRTIDYATGLLNYFFRGRLKAEPNWTDPNYPVFVITNDSNNSGIAQTLKGGTFEIYRDDINDTRSQIDPNHITITSGWDSGSALAYDANIIIVFAKPAEAVKQYVVVYKGEISQNPSDPDPCDSNAIAVCVLSPGFEIVAWGSNDYNQISDVPPGSDFIAVAAGRRHGLALKSDGSIRAWGSNLYGQCDVPEGNDFFIAIAAGSRHSIAIKSDGSIVVWGDNTLNQITNKPDGNDFVAITAGEYHSLALKSDGSIVGWGGWNSSGECNAPAPDAGTVYTQISAGIYHSMALQSDGMPKAWGSNNQGQTRFYSGITGIAQVAACSYYSMVLRDDQWITTWGNGDWVTPNVLPRYHHRPADGNDFVAVAAGWDHILALTSDGKVFAWNWPMGDYSFESFSRDVPEDIVFAVGSLPQASISAGYDFSLALKVP